MPNNAQLAAKLLRDASGFFRQVGEQNPPVAEQMTSNAEAFEQVASMVETDPLGEIPMPEGASPPPAQ